MQRYYRTRSIPCRSRPHASPAVLISRETHQTAQSVPIHEKDKGAPPQNVSALPVLREDLPHDRCQTPRKVCALSPRLKPEPISSIARLNRNPHVQPRPYTEVPDARPASPAVAARRAVNSMAASSSNFASRLQAEHASRKCAVCSHAGDLSCARVETLPLVAQRLAREPTTSA